MKIPPSYTIIPEILKLLSQIDTNRMLLASYDIPSLVKEKIQRVSLLKSSLFSARIEGNTLQMDDISYTSDQQKKKEVFNLLDAAKWLAANLKARGEINKETILGFHKKVMKNLGPAGFFRIESSAIFNMAGIAVYMAPPPAQVAGLLNSLLEYANSEGENFPLITAFITHLVFEKIHPFLDGNGRVGRLLINAVLKRQGYDFGFFIPFEEYLDAHKEEYYYHLDNGLQETNNYLLFMLQSFFEQTQAIKDIIFHELKKEKEVLLLPPRQEEIYNIIKDHRMVSFDFIKRRFLKIPARTLRYDLKKMQEKDCIVKIGGTKGAFYSPLPESPAILWRG